jgi:FMN phosphatase YigB (HAD superfamily)
MDELFWEVAMNHNNMIRAVIWDLGGVISRPAPSNSHRPSADLDGDRLDQNLLEFVRAIRGFCRTGLLISSWSDLWQALAYQEEIDSAFDILIQPEEPGFRRGDPRLFNRMVNRLGVQPQEAVFVDDSLLGVAAARSAGLQAVRFENPAQVGSELFDILSEPVAA